ncbi:MAG: hypothetical protein IV100_07405 [Myxococcales bacterium]|nr:hypothetical protein [Myxococcales bacterium]
MANPFSDNTYSLSNYDVITGAHGRANGHGQRLAVTAGAPYYRVDFALRGGTDDAAYLEPPTDGAGAAFVPSPTNTMTGANFVKYAKRKEVAWGHVDYVRGFGFDRGHLNGTVVDLVDVEKICEVAEGLYANYDQDLPRVSSGGNQVWQGFVSIHQSEKLVGTVITLASEKTGDSLEVWNTGYGRTGQSTFSPTVAFELKPIPGWPTARFSDRHFEAALKVTWDGTSPLLVPNHVVSSNYVASQNVLVLRKVIGTIPPDVAA